MRLDTPLPAAILVLVFALSATPARAGSDELVSARVDEIVRAQMQDQHIPGASLAVVRDGKLIKASAYGFANLELQVPATVQSVYEIGSITKQFTAAAIMLLVQEGKVGLDDSITKYIPEASPAWKPVTIRALLTHTSGAADVWDELDGETVSSGLIDIRRDYTEDELARIYTAQALVSEPGDKWSYCNVTYQLLGFVIHRLTGRYYADYFADRFFGPLAMTATRVFSWEDVVPNRVTGYRTENGKFRHRAWMSSSVIAAGDGGILSTVLDLATWDTALYGEGILTSASREQMYTPVRLNSGETFPYGFGWSVTNANGHRVIWHTGGGFGFFNMYSRYIDDRLAIILLTNADEYDEVHRDIVRVAASIASIYIPETEGANPIKDW